MKERDLKFAVIAAQIIISIAVLLFLMMGVGRGTNFTQ